MIGEWLVSVTQLLRSKQVYSLVELRQLSRAHTRGTVGQVSQQKHTMFLSTVLISTAHSENSNGTEHTMYPEPIGSVQEQADSTTSTVQPPLLLDAAQASPTQVYLHTHGVVSYLAEVNTAPKAAPERTPTR